MEMFNLKVSVKQQYFVIDTEGASNDITSVILIQAPMLGKKVTIFI